MTDTEFLKLVREMRNAQRSFFRVKNHENLLAAKKLESQVDEALQREFVHEMFARSERAER